MGKYLWLSFFIIFGISSTIGVEVDLKNLYETSATELEKQGKLVKVDGKTRVSGHGRRKMDP